MRIARRIRQQRHDDTLSDSQLSVLYVLSQHGGSTLAALAEHERVTPPSMNSHRQLPERRRSRHELQLP